MHILANDLYNLSKAYSNTASNWKKKCLELKSLHVILKKKKKLFKPVLDCSLRDRIMKATDMLLKYLEN